MQTYAPSNMDINEELTGKHRILIVEDDEGTQRLLSMIFTKNRYEVETAATGQEAIDKAHKTPFHMVLIDIILPDMEGIDLIASLKEIHPNTVIIMITAYPSVETAIRSVNEGASAYITKPLNMNEVLATVRALLEKQDTAKMNRNLYELTCQELNKLQYQIAMQKLVSSIAVDLIRLLPEDFDNRISDVLKEVAEFTGADHAYVFLFSSDGAKMDNTHEWCAQGIDRQIDKLKRLETADFAWWMGKLERLESIYVPCVDNLLSEAKAEKEILRLQGVRSFLIAPMICDGLLVGFLELGSVEEERLKKDTTTLATGIAGVLANKFKSKSAEKLRILVGEDEPLLSTGICSAIQKGNMELVGLADNGDRLIEIVSKHKPDVVVVDFDLPGPSAKDLIMQIREVLPTVDILVVSRTQEDTYRFATAIQAGAAGCLPVSVSMEQLAQAINSIHCDQIAATVDMVQQLVLQKDRSDESVTFSSPLNPRELEILELASLGLTNKAIAARLSISKRTVDSHFRYIFSKMAVSSRIEAVRRAEKNGWIKCP
jgi:DNA-binding NarL/FixJ family response regulator